MKNPVEGLGRKRREGNLHLSRCFESRGVGAGISASVHSSQLGGLRSAGQSGKLTRSVSDGEYVQQEKRLCLMFLRTGGMIAQVLQLACRGSMIVEAEGGDGRL